MPFVSKAQQRYFMANRTKLESQGVNVSEWERATKGKSLPERKGKTKAQVAKAKLKRGMIGKKR
jgi:hypothetical protein